MADRPPHIEQELTLHELRDAILNLRHHVCLTPEQKLEAIEEWFSRELDEGQAEEEGRDRERLSRVRELQLPRLVRILTTKPRRLEP